MNMKYLYGCLCIIFCIVQLSTAQSEWTIRLVDGSRYNEGRVEIYYNERWGTICDDGWSTEDADVVCRQLGFRRGGSVIKNGAYFGEGQGTIWLRDLACDGTESSLESCTKSEWNDTASCQHTQDVGVICQPISRLIEGVTPYEGFVEIYHEGQWGYLCDEVWTDTEATVVCNHLGHEGIGAVGNTKPIEVDVNGTIWENDLQCMGLEYSLVDCTRGSFNQTSTCDASTFVQCTPKEPDVRLVDGIKPTEGRVEYLYNGTWGTVCELSDYWRNENAQVVCRQLGLNPKGAVVKVPVYYGEGKGPTWFSDVECTGSESSLADCPHSGWNNPGCNHTRDLAVSCGPVMRLVGGEKTNEGLVEIWYNNTWSEICAGSFGQTEAEIVCHHLGYNRTGSIVIPSLSFDETQDEVWIKDLKCTGSEPILQRCNLGLLASTETCPTSNYAAVRCAPKPPTVRLVGGFQSNEGRVEVKYNGVWGTVCGSNWDKWNAAVVCRQLGFDPKGAQKRGFSHFGEGTGQVWLNRVDCRGTEARIEDCELDGWGSSQSPCEHYYDASVVCRPLIYLEGSKVDYEGRVNIWFKDTWTGICDENWGAEVADVVCRHLGFNPSLRLDNVDITRFGQSTNSVWLTNITCNGSESSLTECSYGDVITADSCPTSTIVLCSPGEPVIRLEGGKSFYEGRVEYRYNNTWGTVCEHTHWYPKEARVACRELGLPAEGAKPIDGGYTDEATGPIWLNNVRCYKYGIDRTLDDCSHEGWYNWAVGDEGGEWRCDHTSDVAIACSAPVRLSGGRGNHEGLVEFFYKGEWGAVCGDGLNTSEAKVICDILGINSSEARVEQGSGIEQTKTNNWMYNVSCSGYENRLTDCQIPIQWQDAGMCSNQAHVVCLSVPNVVRLVGGNSSYQGRLEYFHNGEWGTICGDMFGNTEASVACRQLGFTTQGAHYESNAFFGEGTGPIWLDDLRCNGEEKYLTDCLNAGWGEHNCRHQHDVSVICTEPSPVANVSISKDQDSNFIEGENAILTCTSTETYPQATIRWYVNGEEVSGTTTTVNDGISTSILEFQPSRLHQDPPQMPVVFCSAYNGLGNSVTSSKKLTLDLFYGPDSVIITPEGEQYVKEGGKSSTISCSAACKPTCIISWQREDTKGDNLISSSNGVLQMSNVHRSDTGKYYCRALNKFTGKNITNFVDFKVIYGPSSVTFNPPTEEKIEVVSGQNLEIACQSDCFPECMVQWFKDTISDKTKLVDDKILKLTAVNRDSTGDYICQVRHTSIDNAMVTKKFSLSVQYAPVQDTATETKSQLPIKEGKPAEMSFRVSSNPPPTFKWYKLLADGTKVELKDPRIKQKDTSTSSTLEINEVQTSDYGRYVVYAKNDRGTSSMVYHLQSPSSPTANVDGSSSGSQDLGVGAGIGIGILIAAIVVVMVIIILFLVKKKRGRLNGFPNGLLHSAYAMTDKY